MKQLFGILCGILSCAHASISLTPLQFTKLSTYDTTCKGSGCVEVLSYDTKTRTVSAVLSRDSSIVVLGFENRQLVEKGRINVGVFHGEAGYGAPNSISTYQGVMAVALNNENYTSPGFLRLYDIEKRTMIDQVVLSAMPDMLLFSKDGQKIYAVGEGEPTSQENPGSDPNIVRNPGGIFWIVSLSWVNGTPSIKQAKDLPFQDYVDRLDDLEYAGLLDRGMRVDPRLPGKDYAGLDIEPEYIAVSDDGRMAYVTLQENNAIGVVDLVNERIVELWPLGARDLNVSRADLSPDDGINMRTWANVYMWHQPDTIAYHKIAGRGYVFTANEGDAKEEKRRVGDMPLCAWDPVAFPNLTVMQSHMELGSVRFDPLRGLKYGYDRSVPYNRQCGYDRLYMFGSRSFSIYEADTGHLAYNSGEWMERITSEDARSQQCFNCDRDTNNPDSRSPHSGIEPEALVVFDMHGRTYMAVGLERESGFMVFDVSNAKDPQFVMYVVDRNFTAHAEQLGNLAPEMIEFVPEWNSPTGTPLLFVTYEISGEVVAYEISGGGISGLDPRHRFYMWLGVIMVMIAVSIMVLMCLFIHRMIEVRYYSLPTELDESLIDSA